MGGLVTNSINKLLLSVSSSLYQNNMKYSLLFTHQTSGQKKFGCYSPLFFILFVLFSYGLDFVIIVSFLIICIVDTEIFLNVFVPIFVYNWYCVFVVSK